MTTKSFLAAEWTLDHMANDSRGRLYLWTFTFRESVGPDEIGPKWACLRADLRPCGLDRGIRVFEFHPGGHGLHVHVVTDRYCDARTVWAAVGDRYGRPDVQRIRKGGAKYVLKYLFKTARGLGVGRRAWDVFGCLVARVKVRDIEFDSAMSRFCRAALAMVQDGAGRALKGAERCEVIRWCRETWAGQGHAAPAACGGVAWPWATPSLVSDLNNYFDGWLGDKRDQAPAWLRDGLGWVGLFGGAL